MLCSFAAFVEQFIQVLQILLITYNPCVWTKASMEQSGTTSYEGLLGECSTAESSISLLDPWQKGM